MCVPGGQAREQQGQSQYDQGEIIASKELDDTELEGEALGKGHKPKGEWQQGQPGSASTSLGTSPH